jgi:hypothetical protein
MVPCFMIEHVTERWSIEELDDTPAQGAPLRGRALALAALAVVAVVLIFATQSRPGVADPAKTPAPTFSRNDSGTSLPSEAETWGAIWSRAQGVGVLRPAWLPKSKDEYQVFPGAVVSSGGSFTYGVSYYELRSTPGAAVWHIDLIAASFDGPGGVVQLGGVPESVTVRGQAALLTGNGSPGWVLVWNEGNSRYAIQAFGVSRDDLLHVADSLAPVVDEAGDTS